MDQKVRVFNSADTTIQQMAEKIYSLSENIKNRYFYMAISGGNTPLKLFKHLCDQYTSLMPWSRFKVFWGDERCVPADDPESNYGMAYHYLFRHVDIPNDHIYRIKGENEPLSEAERYSSVLYNNLPFRNGFPRFDLIILGMGDDGHIASIFPDQMHLFDSKKFCEVSEHPKTGQKRITLTGRVVNNADNIVFLVTGDQKASALSQVIYDNNKDLPASLVRPYHGLLEWYLDASAADF